MAPSRRPATNSPGSRRPDKPGRRGTAHEDWLRQAKVAAEPPGDRPRRRFGAGGAFSPAGYSKPGTPAQSLPDPLTLLAALSSPSGGPPITGPVPLPESSGPFPPPVAELSRAALFGVVKTHPKPLAETAVSKLVERGRFLLGRWRPLEVPAEVGNLLLGLLPAPIIVVSSRKGGVGKTAIAAAVAQVLGYAISETAGTAAIVDQNIGNADQWGRLDVAENAYTVRDLMGALEAGWELPAAPTWASTPALAVYPESRDGGDGYAPGLIQRFAQHLRERHVATLVDLPNRLPAYSSAEAAVCASWIDVADLVLLPTTDDPNALTGVLEYLDAPSLAGLAVVVPYIVSNLRDIRENPRVVEMIGLIGQRVSAVVEIPKSEKATLAIVEGKPILEVDSQLRGSYIELTLACMRALAERRRSAC